MPKIYIKKVKSEDETVSYIVPALAIKNSDNTVRATIPHPMGSTTMKFESTEEVISALETSGFEYVLPEGEQIYKKPEVNTLNTIGRDSLGNILYKKIAPLTENLNNNVASSALQGLSNIGYEEAIDIFLDKMGEDNEAVRTSAINGLVKYSTAVVDRLIEALEDANWVKRNSAITCLSAISDIAELDTQNVVIAIVKRIDDENPIVQANAILTASKIYQKSLE